jgi:hypothetical protein
MASKKSKEPTACDGGSLGIVHCIPALNVSDNIQIAFARQATFIERRFRLPAAHARLIASLHFGEARNA